MRTIHKYQVVISKEAHVIDLPESANIVHIDYLVSKRGVYMWVEVPADMMAPKQPREFRIFLTGDGIPSDASYLGTTIDQHLSEVYHVYEMLG